MVQALAIKKSVTNKPDIKKETLEVLSDKDSPRLQPIESENKVAHSFSLNADTATGQPDDFELEADQPQDADNPQVEFFLPQENPEKPEPSPQIDFDGMQPHQFAIKLESQPDKVLHFKHSRSLLEALEAQDVNLPYQCREGYCGSCRTTLLEGEVTYTQEPLAWLNDGEILPCCCIPKTDLNLKLKG